MPLPYIARRLTPAQAAEVRRQRAAGATIEQLVDCYGVNRRTVYRTLVRTALPVVQLRAGSWVATFELTELGPVQATPWMHAGE